MTHTIHNGNNIDILKTYPDNHFDAIVTDPPYGIEFLAKEWDKNTGAVETWAECYRVLKPGGYLLAFSAARTYHNLATNIEGVGFEIRDQLMWLYASGFPKAQDIGKAIQKRQGVEETKPSKGMNAYPNDVKLGGNLGVNPGNLSKQDYPDKKAEVIPTSPEAQQWEGWKTALKPAHEPIVMARKPFKGSAIDNVLKHGVGALNIDESRVPFEDETDKQTYKNNIAGPLERSTAIAGDNINMFDGNTGFKAQKGKAEDHMVESRFPSNVLGEVEGYQKFFYCPKVSRAERHIGCVDPGVMFARPRTDKGKPVGDGESMVWDPKVNGQNAIKQQPAGTNNHPTVKPVALMRYLIKLVTPKGGKVLDPFTGSGSTGMAAVELGCDFTGCELDEHYVDIANTRITAWKNKTDLAGNKLPEEFFEEE